MSITLPTTPTRKYKGGLVPDSLLGPSWARIGTISDENTGTIASASSAYESFVEPPLTTQIHAGSFARRHMLHRLNPVAPAMERTPPTPAPTVRVVLAASGSLPSLGTLLNKLEPLELKHLNADADMVPCVGTEDITAFVIDASPSTKKELQDKVNGIRVKLGRRKLNIRVFDFDDSWESLYLDMWLPFLQASGFKRKSGIRVVTLLQRRTQSILCGATSTHRSLNDNILPCADPVLSIPSVSTPVATIAAFAVDVAVHAVC